MHIALSVISHINFRFFPIREGIETVATDDIWKLLYKHVQSHYPSLKQAFLQIDAVSLYFHSFVVKGNETNNIKV